MADRAFTVWDETVISGNNHKGFSMRFANGYVLSVTWGPNWSVVEDGVKVAEVAVFGLDGEIMSINKCQTPEEVIAAAALAMS